MQWAIFAIRNLCEKNRKNQAIIAGLRKQGTVSTAVLDELSITLDSDKGIKLVTLEDLNK